MWNCSIACKHKVENAYNHSLDLPILKGWGDNKVLGFELNCSDIQGSFHGCSVGFVDGLGMWSWHNNSSEPGQFWTQPRHFLSLLYFLSSLFRALMVQTSADLKLSSIERGTEDVDLYYLTLVLVMLIVD